jgi:protein SCO1/2
MMIKRKNIFWGLALWVLTLLILGCRAFGADYEFKGTVMDPPQPMPDFELMATTGDRFRLSSLEGDIALIYFGYTYCPDVCPLTMWNVQEALEGLERGRERVHVIFISVDPERDTPEVLGRYLANFDPNFIGLTDDWEKIEAVMQPYGAFAAREEVKESSVGYLMSHTARLFLVGPQREWLLSYPFGFEPEDLRSDLAHLIAISEPPESFQQGTEPIPARQTNLKMKSTLP